jgi:hypothetical protein
MKEWTMSNQSWTRFVSDGKDFTIGSMRAACLRCRNKEKGRLVYIAFPRGIPQEIKSGENDHANILAMAIVAVGAMIIKISVGGPLMIWGACL